MPLSEQEKAVLAQKRGQLAAHMKDQDAARKFTAKQGEVDAKGGKDTDYAQLEQETQNEENDQAVGDVLGSRKHGGPIHKTGLYKLHAGEHVIPANHTPRHSIHRAAFHVRKGNFHRWLGKNPKSKITPADIQHGLNSDNPHVRMMANFARNAKHWHHGG